MHLRRALSSLVVSLVICAGCGDDDSAAPDTNLVPDGSMFACADSVNVERDIFEVHCGSGLCHDADAPEADLDLVTEGVFERIESRNSDYPGCEDRRLIVRGSARGSFMIQKILGLHGDCGEQMPREGGLTNDEISCIAAWIERGGS